VLGRVCVLVLAAGVRRMPAPATVGLQRLNFDTAGSKRWDWTALTRLTNSGCARTTISNRRTRTKNDVLGCAPDYSQARVTNRCLAAELSRHQQPRPRARKSCVLVQQ
jgi:hypothetical protein